MFSFFQELESDRQSETFDKTFIQVGAQADMMKLDYYKTNGAKQFSTLHAILQVYLIDI